MKSKPRDRMRDVVVIGAGISGLAVAYRLKLAGVQASVVDAASRVVET